MRVIKGKINEPNSARILVIRGIDPESLNYLLEHTKKYPTWGCLVFPEKGVTVASIYRHHQSGSIHQLITAAPPFVANFASETDELILKFVDEKFPPYIEDDDPIVYDDPPTVRLPPPERIPRFEESRHFGYPKNLLDRTSKLIVSSSISPKEIFFSGEKAEDLAIGRLKNQLLTELIKGDIFDIQKVAKPYGGTNIIVKFK